MIYVFPFSLLYLILIISIPPSVISVEDSNGGRSQRLSPHTQKLGGFNDKGSGTLMIYCWLLKLHVGVCFAYSKSYHQTFS